MRSFLINEKIIERNKHNLRYKPRDAFNDIADWIESDTKRKILALDGLRRTGKTVLLMQVCEKYVKAGYNVAYALISKMTDLNDFSSEVKQLAYSYKDKPYIMIIDSITYADWFIDFLYDVICEDGFEPKVIISASHSLALRMEVNGLLNCYSDLIRISYISYKEYSRIMNDSDIMAYIRFAGMLLSSKEVGSEELHRYIFAGIVDDLEETFRTYEDSWEWWPDTDKHFKKSEMSLLPLVEEFIIGSDEPILMNSVQKEFKDRNLPYALRHIPDNKLSKYLVSMRYRKVDYIIEIGDRQRDSEGAVLEELIPLLLDIEALTLGKIYEFNGGDTDRILHKAMINQPRLRYEQAMESIKSLNLSASELGISEDERGDIIEKLTKDAEDRLFKQAVWLNTLAGAKKIKDCEAFQARYNDKEIDIILKRGQNLALIEVKRSSKVIPSQSKWLRDEEFTRMVSGKFGNIVKRYVVYTGNTHKKVIDGIEIEYVNASEFLTSYIEA